MVEVFLSLSPSASCSLIFFGCIHLSLLSLLTLSHITPPTHTLQTVMVSLDGLSKIVDASQLTADFEGSLDYNHDEWIEVCILSRV